LAHLILYCISELLIIVRCLVGARFQVASLQYATVVLSYSRSRVATGTGNLERETWNGVVPRLWYVVQFSRLLRASSFILSLSARLTVCPTVAPLNTAHGKVSWIWHFITPTINLSIRNTVSSPVDFIACGIQPVRFYSNSYQALVQYSRPE
jgi:hypothetical protein